MTDELSESNVGQKAEEIAQGDDPIYVVKNRLIALEGRLRAIENGKENIGTLALVIYDVRLMALVLDKLLAGRDPDSEPPDPNEPME